MVDSRNYIEGVHNIHIVVDKALFRRKIRIVMSEKSAYHFDSVYSLACISCNISITPSVGVGQLFDPHPSQPTRLIIRRTYEEEHEFIRLHISKYTMVVIVQR